MDTVNLTEDEIIENYSVYHLGNNDFLLCIYKPKKEQNDQKQGDHKVGEGPRELDDQALPGLLVVEGPGVLCVGVLPRKGAVTAQRDEPEGKELPALSPPGEQLGAEPHRELLDGKPQLFAGQVVPELVHGDHEQQR